MLHSKQWHYSLHRDFQNCYSTRRSLTRFFKLQFQLQCQLQSYTCTIQRILHPESILHAEDKELFEYYSPVSRNSTHRRQGDLLEMHPCVLHDIPGNSSCSRDIPGHSSHSRPSSLSRQFYNVPVSPGNPPHSSILRLECIFYSSIGFHRKLHRVPVGQLQTLQTFIHSSKKGRCCDIGQTCIGKDVKMTYLPMHV